MQIINADLSILDAAQLTGEAEAKSYLRQKYDVTRELDATTVYDQTQTYKADNTVYLDATPYNATSGTYTVGALTLYLGKVYKCTVAIPAPEAFNAGHWLLFGSQYTILFGTLPKPLFDYIAIYKVGDMVFWKDKVYTSLQATQVLSPNQEYQTGQILPTPVINVFPDDPTNGPAFWGTGIAYSIAPNASLTNPAIWTVGDNRDQQMVTYFIDLTLYHVHSRIAPRNIPELRERRYKQAISWLKDCASGLVTPELPVLQPKQGRRIRFGGDPKAQNKY